MKYSGFTLAEVLITIVIIAVVSILTITVVVPKIVGYSNMKAHQVFHKKFDAAITMMQGANALGGYESTEAFVDQLRKYIRIAKICDNEHLTECFTAQIKSATGERDILIENGMKLHFFSQNCAENICEYHEPNTNIMGLILQDGTNILLAYRPDVTPSNDTNYGPDYSAISLVYDFSGGRKPNKVSILSDFKQRLSDNVKGVNMSLVHDIGKINAPYFDQYTMAELFAMACTAQDGTVDGGTCVLSVRKLVDRYRDRHVM